MHQRLFPKRNGFTYPIYYLALPLQKIDELDQQNILSVDRFARTSFYRKDHGSRERDCDLRAWAYDRLAEYGLHESVEEVTLITMPRIYGFVFNPVSFWLCFDECQQLIALLYEVNNTYGETHLYVCAHEDGSKIMNGQWISASKEFHVSPYLKREGTYKFKIQLNEDQLAVWINFVGADGVPMLATSLKGELHLLTRQSLNSAFWRMPFIPQQAISLIFWQALKLKAKGLAFFSLPQQKKNRVSFSASSEGEQAQGSNLFASYE
jgi:hypothetical protein